MSRINLLKGRVVLLFSFLLLCDACQPKVDLRGNISIAKQIENFKVGKTTSEDVYKACGSPSLQRGDNIWIYVGSRSEVVAFRDVEVKDKLVVRLIFDNGGVLRKIEKVLPVKSPVIRKKGDSEVTKLRKK